MTAQTLIEEIVTTDSNSKPQSLFFSGLSTAKVDELIARLI
jgi:hypothetical protein